MQLKLTKSYMNLSVHHVTYVKEIRPYLFLLCAEGLSSLMKKKEQQGYLRGVRNGSTGPPVSHLLFADDTIFFIRGDAKSVQALNDVLQVYSNGSGQQINFSKSSI